MTKTTSVYRRGWWVRPAVMVAVTLIMAAAFTYTLHANVGDFVDSVLNIFVGWIAAIIKAIIGFFLDGFMAALGTDMSVILTALPGLSTFHGIITGTGIGLMCLIAVVQFLGSFTAGFGIEGEHPVLVVGRMLIAALTTIGGAALCKEILGFLSVPYFLLLTEGGLAGNNDGLTDTIYDNLTSGAAMDSKTLTTIVGIILLVIVAWNLMRLVIEAVKRYVYCGLLVYLSPLAFSTLTSKATSRIAGSFVSMFMGHGLMLVLNVWCVSLVVNAVGAYSNFVSSSFNIANPATGGSVMLQPTFFLWTLIVIALIKFGLGLEEVLNKVGLHTTGARQMSAGIMMGAAALMRMLGGRGRAAGGAGGGVGGGALGNAARSMGRKAGQFFDRGAGNTTRDSDRRANNYANDVAKGNVPTTTNAAGGSAEANLAQTQAMAKNGKQGYNMSRAQVNDMASGKAVNGMQNTMGGIDKRDKDALAAAKNLNQAAGDHLRQFDGMEGTMDLNHVTGVQGSADGKGMSVFAPAKGAENEGKLMRTDITTDADYAKENGYMQFTTSSVSGHKGMSSHDGTASNPQNTGTYYKTSTVDPGAAISRVPKGATSVARQSYNQAQRVKKYPK